MERIKDPKTKKEIIQFMRCLYILRTLYNKTEVSAAATLSYSEEGDHLERHLEIILHKSPATKVILAYPNKITYCLDEEFDHLEEQTFKSFQGIVDGVYVKQEEVIPCFLEELGEFKLNNGGTLLDSYLVAKESLVSHTEEILERLK